MKVKSACEEVGKERRVERNLYKSDALARSALLTVLGMRVDLQGHAALKRLGKVVLTQIACFQANNILRSRYEWSFSVCES